MARSFLAPRWSGDRTLRAALILAACSLLGACAAWGPARFVGVAAPEAATGDVYVVRTAADMAANQDFTVLVDDVVAGELSNGSFLWLRLHPGGHQLKVVPGRASEASQRHIEVKPGSARYYQFEVATGSLANAFLLGSQLRERRAEDVAEFWSDLHAANPPAREGSPLQPVLAGSAIAVDDVDAVPLLDAHGRAGYREWLRRAPPRAFVLAADGNWSSAWGVPRVGGEGTDAVQRAIRQCEAQGQRNCRLYAIDNRVVWDDHSPH